VTTDDTRKLLWVLRSDLGLTGTKFGCGQGMCGTCTVMVDQQAVRSCQVAVAAVAGAAVRTIEGLGQQDTLHPLQQAFVDHQAVQCGFCTPGMLMAAYALLLNVPSPSATAIAQHLDRNLCRCGTHARIIRAVASVATAGARS
jgi:aerobic-type carbon monoxide dehydrogenase small subunit (CoxS/CutS family)